MRVVHVSVSDKENGAHLAGFRLHRGLLRLGVESKMFVVRRLDDSGDETIRVYQPPTDVFRRAMTFAYRRWLSRDLVRHGKHLNREFFIYDRAAEGRRAISQMPAADVIYIHSAYGFIDYLRDLPLLAQCAPIVFELHDMSFFTGGCSYDDGCGRFTERCGACPLFQSHDEHDPSRHVWERKHTVFSRIRDRLHFVAASRWTARQARRSSLLKDFPIDVIPYGIDTEIFRPSDRVAAREILGVPKNSRVLLYAAHPVDRVQKGFACLAEAVRKMNDREGLFLLVAGGGKLPAEVPIPHRHLGRIHDERLLSLAYCAADVFVMPSLQEAFGLTAIEAMASGTPVIAFASGGIAETVRDGVTGLHVPTGDTSALGESISQLLRNSAARARMSENARKVAVSEYSMSVQAKSHAGLLARITSLVETAACVLGTLVLCAWSDWLGILDSVAEMAC
jgi:glycosyltransferase involved in cell wall biosynthesis